MTGHFSNRWEVMIVLLLASFALVALDRWHNGLPIWDELTFLYSALVTAISLLVLKLLKVVP